MKIDEDSDSRSDKENLPVFDWIINIKLLNENLKEVAVLLSNFHSKVLYLWSNELLVNFPRHLY